jgi:hypothetical protein
MISQPIVGHEIGATGIKPPLSVAEDDAEGTTMTAVCECG